MGVNVSSLQVLLNEILEIGANAAVLADTTGLVIASEIASGYEESLTEVLGAISSLLIPQGEQVAAYLSGGVFEDTVIHTSSGKIRTSVLAYTLVSDPKTCIMIICEPSLESQVIHEFSKVKSKFVHALEGIAVELPDKLNLKVDRKVSSYWNTLEHRVAEAKSVDEIKRALLDARDNYAQIHGSYSTILYAMNTASKSIDKIDKISGFDNLKETISKDVKTWKNRILGVEEIEKNDDPID